MHVQALNDLEERAWTRLGQILGDASHVDKLSILRCPTVNVAKLCVGLRSNQSIKNLTLTGIDLGDEELISLGPFLIHNPSLSLLDLSKCNLTSTDALGLLSAALLQRSEDNLEHLSLRGNHVSDLDLEILAPVLKRNVSKMKHLNLGQNQIGSRGCVSLVTLLGSQECNLFSLSLRANSIDDKAVAMLIDSLAKNTKLMTLNLGNNDGITTEGWLAMLKLVCDTSCIKGILDSNHYLCDVGMFGTRDVELLHRALGIDDGNLLCASLEANAAYEKTMSVRRKILWSHARGNLNIGDSFIVPGVMPRILAWIGGYSNANLIQYHTPPLPKDKMEVVRFDAIFRIVQFRPDLCKRNKGDATCKKRRLF